MDKHNLKICPFNRNHIVPTVSFQNHIIRCKRNYKGRKVPCPYMATEYLYPEELLDHVTSCRHAPDYVPTGKQHGSFQPTEFVHNLPVDEDDDWD